MMCLDEESTCLYKKKEELSKVVSHRRTKPSDMPEIRKLIRMKTCEMFGNINCARVYEESCLSLVQLNEKEEIVSHVSLYTYPNVPSIPRSDWICWMIRHYGLESVSSGNVLFIHFLVWDIRYTGEFFDKLLKTIFSMATFCLHLILVYPPLVIPVDVIEEHMTRVVPRWEEDTYKVQAIYITIRHRKNSKFTLRLAVEEDNDDIVRIIDGETKKLKELYGEYYVSEMMRYPDGQRQIIVSETDGAVIGVMCITKSIDLNLLNEVFELGPYNGLRKFDKNETRKQSHGEKGVKSESFFQSEAVRNKNVPFSNSEIAHVPKKGKDNIFVCQCSHQKSRRNGEICPICFHGATICRLNESEKVISKDGREEIKVEVGNDKKESDSEEDENEDGLVEEIEREELVIKKEDIDENIRGNGEDTLIEKKKIVEALIEEEFKVSKKENQTEEEKNKKLSEVREENSKMEIGNMKFKNLSQVAFTSLLMSKGEDQDLGFNQLLLAHSVNLQSKTRISVFADTLSEIPDRRGSISGPEISELIMQEFKASNFSTSSLKGDPNAFILELFSLQDEIYEQCNQDFLQAAFECFPDMDYCAILLPSTHHFFPLMENFVRVPLRFNKDFPMALYLAHRVVFSGTLKAREAVPYDLEEDLIQFLYAIPGRELIIQDCQEAVYKINKEKECLVFLCEDILIGVAVLSFEKEVNFLRRHYHIDDYVSIQNIPISGHGRLLHFVIMPIFAVCHRFFYREILRLTERSILYYRLYESDASSMTRIHPLVNCLNVMIPVEPRFKIEYAFQHYYEKTLEPPMNCQENERFSLFLMTPQLVTIPKPVINKKIVVVGASDCGMAFIELLALGSRLNDANFTNLTLISSNGLPYEKKRPCLEKNFIPFKGRYCYAHRHMKPARAWFNIITGTVISINRKQKYVRVKRLGVLSYDYLILTCGLQFQKPRLPKEMKDWKQENSKDDETPVNCLSINDDLDAAICIKNVQIWTENFTTKRFIVFYGCNIECYCALNGFLEMGVDGSWITLIEPPLPGCDAHDKIFFNDTEVDVAVINQIAKSGVEILSGWDLIDWELDLDQNGAKVIKNLNIKSWSETKILPCDILMSFSEKRIRLETFMAFSRAGLVFDGLLVIDPEWRTNDPFIFAAGTVTKYSRIYMADSLKLKYFNSLEIGERLAKYLKKKIESDLQEEEPVNTKSKKNKPLPVYQLPRCMSCILPGGFYFLHIHKPGKKMQRRVAISHNIYGDVYVTGNCTSDIGYFRIRINPYGFVESLTCFSKKSFELQNLISLYGKHESLLNNLKTRFQNSLIVDLYAYFREPWSIALFSDKFDCFRVENRAILLSKLSGGECLVDDIIEALIKSNWNQVSLILEFISEDDEKKIEYKFMGSMYQEAIEKSLLDFLQYSGDELPMYCIQRRAREILKNFESSPLFTSQ